MTRVADLTGAELDYWVARAIGWKQQVLPITQANAWFDDRGRFTHCVANFCPHEDWSQGGPLIEQHDIAIIPSDFIGPEEKWSASHGAYGHYIDESLPFSNWNGFVGPTPLIAAMRALVVSKFGEQVDDPS